MWNWNIGLLLLIGCSSRSAQYETTLRKPHKCNQCNFAAINARTLVWFQLGGPPRLCNRRGRSGVGDVIIVGVGAGVLLLLMVLVLLLLVTWIDFNSVDHPDLVTREAVLGLMRNVGYIGQGLITSDTNPKLQACISFYTQLGENIKNGSEWK